MRRTNENIRAALPFLFLSALTVFVCWYFAGRHGMFASKVDWISQHSVFPEYFRQQFYDTGTLFPEFAPGIGGGQNLYHFSYYGLYSPIVLAAYLLPFVKMSDYLIVASVCCLMAAVCLLYAWLRRQGISPVICMAVSVLFLLAGPVVYQSCRQVMFVWYMPFLCMALMGADRYWSEGKRGMYGVGVFLMILTSFYFSIGGILALLLYGVSRYQKTPWKHALLRLVFPILAAVCAAGALLLPTAYALMERKGGGAAQNLWELVTVDVSISRFVWSGYGIGLSAGIFIVLFVCLLGGHARDRFLAAGCFAVIVIPLFSWILNGGLYAREKALIPFLPVLCFLTASYLERLRKREISYALCLAGHAAAFLWCLCSALTQEGSTAAGMHALAFVELGISLLLLLLCKKERCALHVMVLPSLVCLTMSGVCLNGKDGQLIDRALYDDVTDVAWGDAISELLAKEQGLYRLEQQGTPEENKAAINRTWDAGQWITSAYSSACSETYRHFRTGTFQTEQPFRNSLMQSASENPLFQKLMGVKYVIRRAEGGSGFVTEVQEHAAPVAYATDRTLSETAYVSLPFPYNQTALMEYAAVEESGEREKQERLELEEVQEAKAFFSENDAVAQTENGYRILADASSVTQLFAIGREADREADRLLFLQFDVKNNRESQDVWVDIAGIRNKLSAESHIYYNGNTTFTYVCRLDRHESSVEAVFGEGDYAIANLRCFLCDASILERDALYQSAFQLEKEATKGNRICGKIDVKRAGYLITSIPYDAGFAIYVDGKRVATEKVNTAFLGSKVEQGTHRIMIVYHAPGLAAGKLLSCFGIVLLWGLRRRLCVGELEISFFC